MRLNQWMTLLTAGLVFASSNTIAANQPHEQVQVPHCLASKLTMKHQVLAQDKQFQIIDLLASDLTQLAQIADKERCGRFVNVSHKLKGDALAAKEQSAKSLLSKYKLKFKESISDTYEIKHQDEVNAALKLMYQDNIWNTLSRLTSFHNRSATKDTGVEAAKWLKSQFEAMALEYGHTDTDTFFVETGWYKQPSLVTVIGKDIKAPGIVIGAHMDTLDGRMPGAGDDGSGSSTILEMARVLLASKSEFKRPIYIIWYAAEERGLVGSQYVVEHFVSHKIPVKAAIQFDMTGYRVKKDDPTMWVYTDYVDKKLSNFVASLIKTYVKVPVDYSRCGYGCSDHASWTEEGIPSAFPCESNFDEHNPYIHSSSDTMDIITLEHMANFTKLAISFAIELASE